MNFKKFLATVVASAAILAPGAAFADEETRQHQQLWDTLKRVGVHVVANSPNFCDGNVHGFYAPAERLLVVCQDDAKVLNGKMVPWTANDFDTLRHEAQHVVQDCSLGGLGDSRETAFISDDQQLAKFVSGALTRNQINWIISTYEKSGATPHVVKLELEAFAVAATVNAASIADAVQTTCGAR